MRLTLFGVCSVYDTVSEIFDLIAVGIGFGKVYYSCFTAVCAEFDNLTVVLIYGLIAVILNDSLFKLKTEAGAKWGGRPVPASLGIYIEIAKLVVYG